MRKLIFAFLICFITQQVCSQGNFYIYIQSEDNTPFYVRSGSKTFQSSGNGYLIIPNLLNDTYDLIIGFPETAGQEWKFTCSVAEKDLGFILKNKHSKGVELNGLKQENGLTGAKVDNKSEKKAATVKQAVGIISDDPFASMLAEVVNDPTIKQQPTIILTARDSLNLAKAQKKDSVITSLAVNNKLPEIKKEETKTVPTGDSAKATAKTNTPVVPKVDSTLVASAKVTNPVTAKADNNTKKVDSTAVVAAKQNDAAPAEKTAVVIDKEKKTDSIANKSVAVLSNPTTTDAKDAAKKDASRNNNVLADAKKKTDSATVAAVIKPAVTDKKVTDKTTSVIDKENNSKAITTLNNTAPADTKAVVKNDVAKNNPVLIPDTKKKADSIVATAAKPATVVPAVEIKKTAVASSTAIKKTLQRKSADGIELIYVDEISDGTKETIRILIPAAQN